MTFSRYAAIFAFAAFSLPSASMAADVCKPLRQLASIDMIAGPDGDQMIVPVTINGAPKRLLLDTGGGMSALSQKAVEALGLVPIDSDEVRLLDRAGNASSRYVVVRKLLVGDMHSEGFAFMVEPDPDLGANPALPFDGTLTPDLMQHFDVEMDFAARKLKYFLSDHCEGKVIYWPATAIAIVPFRLQHPATLVGDDTLIRVPVKLDGKDFIAVITTGTANSTMDSAAAKAEFGVTADSPGSTPLGAVNGNPDYKVFGHQFKELTFDGVTVTNPRIAVVPGLIGRDDSDSPAGQDDDNPAPQITVGMDVLKKLHLYIAYGERKLYVTPAATAQ